jgi:purine-binding chemotaxis protein CheW
MSRPDDPPDGPAAPEPGSRLPEFGLAEDILRAWDLSGKSPAAEPAPTPVPALTGSEPDLAGPERLFAFADRLAQRQPVPHERPEEPESWISFELAGEIYALPVTCIEEIQRISFLARVPFAPAPVRGITHLRGRVLAVVDLRVRLGLPRAEVAPQSRIIVVESRQRSIGLLVDAARQIVKILPSRILPTPADVKTGQSDFLCGVYPRENDLLILLDLERILWIPGELAASWSTEGA